MALSGTGLKAAVEAKFTADGRTWNTAMDDAWGLICDAIIEYLVANAVVTATVAVTSVSGVTVGAGVSGPGTGSATGTIS